MKKQDRIFTAAFSSAVWPLRLLSVCVVLVLVAGCATQAPVANANIPAARVAHLKGAARCKTGNLAWQQLKPGDLLQPGCMIQTAENSRLDLVLSAGSLSDRQTVVRMWEDSCLGIDQLADAQTQLDLQAGRISGKGSPSPASKYTVKTPYAVATIRAAVFDVSAEGGVKARSGSVVLQ
jgi:hypothetical protein